MATAYMRPRTIEVPLQHEQLLEVTCEDLPPNPVELTDIFRQESVSLTYYRMLAVEYYHQNKLPQSIQVLDACIETANESPHTQPRQKLPLLTLLATLHMRLAKSAAEESEQKSMLEKASKYIQEADRIHNQYEQTMVLKGNLYLLKRDIKEASKAFDNILSIRHNCVPALLGKAKIQYHLRQYKDALKSYQTALVHARRNLSAAEIRLGLAQCYAQLGMTNEAKAALTRCVQLGHIASATALALLAIIELNQAKKVSVDLTKRENALTEGLAYIQEAHKVDPKHPVVLNMMANHFFLTRDFEKTIQSGTKALDSASNRVVKAEAMFQVARAHHQKHEFDDAFTYYQQCLDVNPNHILAQFGIGQMHMKRGHHDVAIPIFEKLLQAEPGNDEIMKILGSLYAASGKEKEAMTLFSRILERSTKDPMLELETAVIYQEKDQKVALTHYKKSLDLYEKNAEDKEITSQYDSVKAEVLNNVAVMNHTNGMLEEAEKYYSMAIQEYEKHATEDTNDLESDVDLKLTMTFNLGRLYEEKGDVDKALTIYKTLTENYPHYFEAHLRLGAITRFRGRTDEAIEQYKEVFDSDDKNPEAWIMIGQAQATINERLCKRAFEKVLKDCDKNDVYTHVALGNYHASVARELKGDKNKKQRADSYKLANGFFSQALKRDPKNTYAANGLAIILADNGHIDQARDLFNQVHESAPSNPCISVNIGHIFAEQKQFQQAVVMYENAIKRYRDEKDTNLFLYLARTQFLLARSEKDPVIMLKSLRNSEKALNLNPQDRTTLYNIALVQQSYCQLLADLPKEQRKSADMRRAMRILDSSRGIFKSLVNAPQQEHILYDRKIAEQREKYGETVRNQLERKLREQIDHEEELEHKRRSNIDKKRKAEGVNGHSHEDEPSSKRQS
ncbi:hypothetical protein BDB00DRAFT_822072 [Zychaea mexicana]|uniref:uncharacterized protein n=1 Tax=Zychaea mexicana TaxID=64656 RepID=UPI0022FDBEFA|nr:uncharacterized protein BDB00DRAFT_822072 [Zychaea mexicana]KAI9493671.1 hypothetical protein BDB00DRAFT_822072 [Zychaea mexicana]